MARDGGAPQQSSQTVVKVRLLDTNNHSPKIAFRFHSAGGSSQDGTKERYITENIKSPKILNH